MRRLLTPHLLTFLGGKLLPEETKEPQEYRYPIVASTEAGEIETVFNEIHLLPHSADYDTLARSNEFAAIKTALLELDRLVRAQNGRFVVVYVPSKEHVLWYRVSKSNTCFLAEGDRTRRTVPFCRPSLESGG